MRNTLKLIGILILIFAPISTSIILGVFVSWWFLLLNLLYLVIVPGIYLCWQNFLIMLYFED